MVDLTPFAKTIILAGMIITGIGLLFLFIDKVPWLGKLPGDIHIEKEDFSFYFPVTTCIIVSIIISAVFLSWRANAVSKRSDDVIPM